MIYQVGPPVSFAAQQVSTGGNPDEYRRVQHFHGGLGSIITGHLRDGAIYNPATDGAVSTLNFSFDLILFDGGESGAVAYGGLIFQNNSYYQGGSMLTPLYGDTNQWQSGYNLSLLASDFFLISGLGPTIPDFSSGGSPMQFGYFAGNGTGNCSPTSTSSGIDNWSVTVNLVPIPSALLLLRSGLAGLIGLRRKNLLKKG